MIIRKGGGAGTNPFIIYENASSNGGGTVLNGNNSISGHTARGSNLLNSGEKTLVLLVIGDSISSNSCQAAYTVTNTTKVDNLNHYDGVVYAYSDPYLGPSTGAGSYPAVIADNLINAGKFARVVIIGCAIGGGSSYDWSKQGSFSHRLVASMLYCREYGYPLTGPGDSGNWQMAVLHCCGTNDNPLGYTAPQYTAYTNSCIQLLRDYGFAGKVFIPEMSLQSGVTSATIQGAQAAIINNSLGIYVGPNFDQYTGATYRQVDNTHPTTALVTIMGSSWASTIEANY